MIKPIDYANTLLFELQTRDGNKYKLFMNGQIEGFPDGTVVINYAIALFDELMCCIKEENEPKERDDCIIAINDLDNALGRIAEDTKQAQSMLLDIIIDLTDVLNTPDEEKQGD